MRIIRQFLELDFSHLGGWRSAPVKGSTNACETFCGSVCEAYPQKVSEPLKTAITSSL